MNTLPNSFSLTHQLIAGETDAQGLMPVTLIAHRAIEIATLHANALGIGYASLNSINLGWVLARIAIEVYRYPTINETYTITTWIEGYNRHYSDRCYELTDADGQVFAAIRSVWVAIDIDQRKMADLTALPGENFPLGEREGSVAKCRPPMIAPDAEVKTAYHTFKYSEIDFNRHVNTLRYLEIALNRHDVDFYDNWRPSRIEASFERECLFGETAELTTGPAARNPEAEVTVISTGGRRAAAVELVLKPLEK